MKNAKWEVSALGKWLMIAGVLLFIGGLCVTYLDRTPLGRLAGDVHVEGEGYSFHFPIVTCIVVSVIATLILKFFNKR